MDRQLLTPPPYTIKLKLVSVEQYSTYISVFVRYTANFNTKPFSLVTSKIYNKLKRFE